MPILDPEQLYAAARRYHERVQAPAAVLAPQTTPSERSDYLSRKLSKERAQLLSVEATASGAVQSPKDTVQQIARERIVGSSDLVDFNFLELAIAMGRGVARLKIGAELGTGFLVGPGLLMTNQHVIESADKSSAALAQFDYQENAAHELLPVHQFRLNPLRFFLSDPTLDFTIVAVEPTSDKGKSLTEYPWIQMIGQTGKAEAGDPINIIQHPRGGLKQIAFRANRVIDIPKQIRDFLYYSTDTEPGSSGSPCFNDQWELIALHHSGVPSTNGDNQILKRDKTAWRQGIDPESLIDWIANEGARISAIVSALQGATLQPEALDLRNKMLGATPPNPVELARNNLAITSSTKSISLPGLQTVGSEAKSPVIPVIGQTVSLTIPLQITLSIGEAVVSAPVLLNPGSPVIPQKTATPELLQEVTIDPNWAGRKGYDPHFLGIAVPFPQLSAAQQADTTEVLPQYQASDDRYVLHYHHYSVKMNKRRRCAWFSVAMIDGNKFFDFKRGKDKWFLDNRIDARFQMGEELYVEDNTDRGHLTRFKDLSWGANMHEAVNATNDSFHFTNCTLQLSGFNQGKDRWQGLELYLLESHARPELRKMAVFTGPVFKSSDPKYKNESMDYTAQIPLAFWKVCVLKRKNGSMAATAFTLGQEDITALPGFEEKLDITTVQVTLADLEQTTGLDFGVLKNNDVFAAGATGVLEALRPSGNRVQINPFLNYEQIVI